MIYKNYQSDFLILKIFYYNLAIVKNDTNNVTNDKTAVKTLLNIPVISISCYDKSVSFWAFYDGCVNTTPQGFYKSNHKEFPEPPKVCYINIGLANYWA